MSINNSLRLIGRLTRDLEVGTTAKKAMFGKSAIAVDEGYKGADGQWVDKTMFVDIIVWGDKSVNYLKDRLKKGTLVALDGKLEINSYTAKDGSKRTSTSMRVAESKVLESRKKSGNADDSNNMNANQEYNPAQEFANQSYEQDGGFNNQPYDPSGFSAIDGDNDIPF